MLLLYFQPLELFVGRGNVVIFINAANSYSCCKILKFLDIADKRRSGGSPDIEAMINVAKDK